MKFKVYCHKVLDFAYGWAVIIHTDEKLRIRKAMLKFENAKDHHEHLKSENLPEILLMY